MNILKSMFGISIEQSQADTHAGDGEPDPSNPWLFTDPDARVEFERNGSPDRLLRDIVYEVMRGGTWNADELDYKRGIIRLLQEGAVEDKGTYWYMSPFPTVYRALRDGSLKVGGESLDFKRGDDLVFQCRMTRDSQRAGTGPCLIARLQTTDRAMLCGEMGSAMKGMG